MRVDRVSCWCGSDRLGIPPLQGGGEGANTFSRAWWQFLFVSVHEVFMSGVVICCRLLPFEAMPKEERELRAVRSECCTWRCSSPLSLPSMWRPVYCLVGTSSCSS